MKHLPKFNRNQVVRHIAFVAIISVISAFTSIILCLCVNAAYRINQAFAWTIFFLPLLTMLSLALYRAFKLPTDYSTDTLIHKMRKNQPVSPLLAPAILIGTCLSILGGAAVGKESSAFQMGASLGETLDRAIKLEDPRIGKKGIQLYGYAASVGMCATFSALFFAPLGATFMVTELMHFKNVSLPRFLAMLVSALVAASIAYPFHIGDIFPKIAIEPVTTTLLLYALLIGVVGGVLGGLFGSAIRGTRAIRKIKGRHTFITALVASCLIVLLVSIFQLQAYEGSGMNLVTAALAGSIGPWDFALKALLVFLAISFGIKGGEIMPTLVIGGLLGCSLGQVMGFDPSLAAAIGIFSFFAGMSRCPLAAFFMGVEIFGIAIAPYLLVAVGFSFFGSRDLGYYGHGIVGFAKARNIKLLFRARGAQPLRQEIIEKSDLPANKSDR